MKLVLICNLLSPHLENREPIWFHLAAHQTLEVWSPVGVKPIRVNSPWLNSNAEHQYSENVQTTKFVKYCHSCILCLNFSKPCQYQNIHSKSYIILQQSRIKSNIYIYIQCSNICALMKESNSGKSTSFKSKL